jgi:voltage-gated potassium channel
MQILIIVSLISFSVETLPDISPVLRMWLHWLDVVIVVIFTIEYIMRIIIAPSIRGYVLSPYGIIDLIAILPFYLALGVDLRAVRVLRMLRLIRVFKLVRYSRAARRLFKATMIAKEEIILFSIVTVMLLYLSAIGIYYFEREAQPDKFSNVFDSMWWAVATLTTVGYGDVYPITSGGRIFTFFVLLLGLGIVSIPTGLLASALLKVHNEEDSSDNQP